MASSMLHLLCVLSALTATGHALSCQICMTSGSYPCEGPTMTCPEGNVCVLAYTETTKDGDVISREVDRGCGPRSQCDNQGSVSIPGGKIKRSTSCCYKDSCFQSMPELPKDDNVWNGVTCATCVSPYEDYCYTRNTMRCTGKENMCILESTHYYKPIEKMLALRGCATKSICDLNKQEVTFGYLNMTMDIRCSNTSPPLLNHFVLLFTVIVAATLAVILSW